jgi:hypothetical protein
MNAENHGAEQVLKLGDGRNVQMETERGMPLPRPTETSNPPDTLVLAIVTNEVAKGIKELASPLSE